MLFVVDRPRLQRIISIVRDDKKPHCQWSNSPFLRIKASNNELTISGEEVAGTFPATVYEPGVLFLRTTSFRRLVRSFKDEKFMTFQVTKEGLSFGNVLLPFQGSDMVYFANPEDAPERWPVEPPEDEEIPEKDEPTLFD